MKTSNREGEAAHQQAESRLPRQSKQLPDLERRRLTQALVGAALFSTAPLPTWAQSAPARKSATATGSAPLLRGTQFDLTIAATPVNFTGVARSAVTINGSLPGPTLVWREGDTVTLRVRNQLAEPTSIHWHGVLAPTAMDGVPGLSFAGIAPGATFTYQFTVHQHGAYWYHSHSGGQEGAGMYGAIIILPRTATATAPMREHVVLLSDWSDESMHTLLRHLRMDSGYYNRLQPTLGDFFRDTRKQGLSAAINSRQMWNQMRMSPFDLADVSALTLTYLVNGVTPSGNWTGLYARGEKVKLHFINGAAHTFFDVRIPGLPLTVVAADGQAIEPVTVDEFRFGPGETYDVVIAPKDDAYTLFAQSMDRSGAAVGTLATRAGLTAPVPALDAPQPLSMADMMGDMGEMGGMDMSHNPPAGALPPDTHAAMSDMTDMDNMDDMSDRDNMSDMPDMPDMNHPSAQSAGLARLPVRHARDEYGASTDMRVATPRVNLDDPGVGLRKGQNGGRRALTLADLHSTFAQLDPREPGRELELHLTGNMERYAWSLDGREFGAAQPIRFQPGERLRVILHNDTMMTHPMHLHGLWSELEEPQNLTFKVRRHTIPVQPAQRVSFRVLADARGRWAWHCHLMLHMHMGMFREVIV